MEFNFVTPLVFEDADCGFAFAYQGFGPYILRITCGVPTWSSAESTSES